MGILDVGVGGMMSVSRGISRVLSHEVNNADCWGKAHNRGLAWVIRDRLFSTSYSS